MKSVKVWIQLLTVNVHTTCEIDVRQDLKGAQSSAFFCMLIIPLLSALELLYPFSVFKKSIHADAYQQHCQQCENYAGRNSSFQSHLNEDVVSMIGVDYS